MTGVQYSGAGRERLVTATAATSDANGGITFRLGPCPLGFVWQGSVTVTGAPSGALFNSSVGSTPWGQHAGSTNFGPVQLYGNETLVVVGVGLLPNTQYAMSFFGVAMPEQMADPLPPVAPLSTVSVETTTLLVNGVTITGGAGTGPTFQPPSLTRRLTLIVDATNQVGFTEIDVIGVQTGTVYTAVNPTAGTPRNNIFFCAIEPAVDTSYKISSSVGGGNTKVWVLASTTNPMVTTNPSEPISVVGSTIPGEPPVNVGGSPVGAFHLAFSSDLAIGANQSLIAAPAAGNSIYLQTLLVASGGPAAVNGFSAFHPAGGGVITTLVLPQAGAALQGGTTSIVFPGGYELPSNTALQVDVVNSAHRVGGTYTVGPTI